MSVQVLTPAKLNLGLEVIRKRPDGFHELATVFQTISVFDHLTLAESQYDEVEIVNRIDQIESNLVQRALSVAREREITDRHWRVEVKKRIPIAAGLGGASADAAAALLALAKSSNVSVNDVAGVALELGSDVPFLLFGGAALAHGRGEVLTRLPSLRNCWLVLATPAIEIERKTARLFGALLVDDFSDGRHVDRVAATMRARQLPEPADLVNAFERALAELMPEAIEIQQLFVRSGAPFVALSGAGPTHYTIASKLSDAIAIAQQLWAERPVPMRVLIARPVSNGPLIRSVDTIFDGETL